MKGDGVKPQPEPNDNNVDKFQPAPGNIFSDNSKKPSLMQASPSAGGFLAAPIFSDNGQKTYLMQESQETTHSSASWMWAGRERAAGVGRDKGAELERQRAQLERQRVLEQQQLLDQRELLAQMRADERLKRDEVELERVRAEHEHQVLLLRESYDGWFEPCV